MSTSTALYINPENASRCLILHVDESSEQTARVLEKQREAEGPEEVAKYEYLKKRIISKHSTAHRLLKKIKVVNPYARFIRFPIGRPIMRRRQKQFLGMNKSICLAHQMQKKTYHITNPYTKEKLPVIVCDIDDYRLAYKLFVEGVLRPNQTELPFTCVKMYEVIRDMVREKAKQRSVDPCEIKFLQSDVRPLVGLENSTVKKHIKRLVDYEYLYLVSSRGRGSAKIYRLREDSPLEELDMSMIPRPEEMEEKIERDKKEHPEKWGFLAK